MGPKLPAPVRWLLTWFTGTVLGDPKMARLMRASRGKSVVELQDWQNKRDLFVAKARKQVRGASVPSTRDVC